HIFLLALVLSLAAFFRWAFVDREWTYNSVQLAHWFSLNSKATSIYLLGVALLIFGFSWLIRKFYPLDIPRRKPWIELTASALIIGIFAGHLISTAHANHGCVDTVNITSNTAWSTNQCHGDVTISNGATLTISGGVTADL